MRGSRSFAPYWLSLACACALVAGLAAQGPGPRPSQGVVTPDSPIFAAQDPSPAPSPAPSPSDPQAPDTPAPEAPGAPEGADGPPNNGSGLQSLFGGRGRGRVPRTYEQFVKDAKADDGIFTVYRIGESVYFEIPKAELDKDFLWVSRMKGAALGTGYGGDEVAERVVRWERRDDRVFLRSVDYDMVADASTPIARAVRDANTPTIVRAFSVLVESPDGNPVIDVTGLLLADIPEFSPRQMLGARGVDQNRTYLEKVVSFPENVNAQVTQTFTTVPGGEGRGRGGMRGSNATVVMFHSIVKLPETPMMPRLADARVGYFTTSMWDYGRDEHKAVERAYIARYRLEKKDPSAAVSEPVTPIVYYIDPATPPALVPWIERAVLAWNPAFEAAGFRNALVVKHAPSPEEDPDWDPEDVRYSVIRWLPSPVENAAGPHVSDPRSGEILEADIMLYHNVMNAMTMWYFTQVGALDPRAQRLPLPDDLMGRLVEYVVTHELGHTLGLRHNMKASSQYSIAQIRDKNWVHEHGHTPSIMDYARLNYVAQPEDGIAVEDLVPRVGPYDVWAIKWGYTPVPGASSPDDERPAVDQWARAQDETPYLRFSTAGESEGVTYPVDPGQEREAVGDADATTATALGIANLRRVAKLLIPATARETRSYADLDEVYARLVSQWRRELGHVVNIVGGMDSRELYAGQQGVRFVPVPKARQRDAVQFLLEHGFETPDFLVDPDLLRRIEPTGVVARVRTAQNSLMNGLLQAERLDRMAETAALDREAYTPLQFLTDLRRGIWKELQTPSAPIDLFRRNTQRVYLDTIDARLNGSTPPSDEVRAMLGGELKVVDAQVAMALPSVEDTATKRHLEDVRATIARILDPRAVRPGLTIGGRGAFALDASSVTSAPYDGTMRLHALQPYDYDNDPFLAAPESCWGEAVIAR